MPLAPEDRLTGPACVASYASLLKPKNRVNDAGEVYAQVWEMAAVWDNPANFTSGDRKKWEVIVDRLLKAAHDEFGVDGKLDDVINKMRMKNLTFALHHNEEKSNQQPYGDLKDGYFANLSSTIKIEVADSARNAAGERIILTSPDEVYSGIVCRPKVNVYVNNKSKTKDGKTARKGVMLGLLNVLKLSDGAKLGGGRSAKSDFDDDNDDDEWTGGYNTSGPSDSDMD